VKNYAKCEVNGQCPQNANNPALSDVCVAFANAPAAGAPTADICLQQCTMTAQCPTGQTCTLPLGSVTACGKPCTATAADAGCPGSTTCQTFTIGSYCAP
jgi:hypothetical protein